MPKLVGVLGDRGDGKTLNVTYNLYRDYIHGRQVIANYHLYFPYKRGAVGVNGKPLKKPIYMSYKEMLSLPPILQNATLALDELHMVLDSRRGLSKSTREFTKFVTQMRKRKIDCYWTSQRANLIDKRIKEQTDIYIICEQFPHPLSSEKKGSIYFRYQVMDAQYYDILVEGDKDGWRYYWSTKFLFSLYDTNEIIDGVEDDIEEDDE